MEIKVKMTDDGPGNALFHAAVDRVVDFMRIGVSFSDDPVDRQWISQEYGFSDGAARQVLDLAQLKVRGASIDD